MILITLTLIFAIVTNLGLGATVFFTNRVRRANQAYLVAATSMLLWLLFNLLTLHSKTAEQAVNYIDATSALATLIPTTFQLLRLAIKHPQESWRLLLKRCTVQILFNLTIIPICFLPSFTRSVQLPAPNELMGLAQPVYGPPFIFFMLYFMASIITLGVNLHVDRKLLQGTQRLESEFLGFACLSGLAVGIPGTFFTIIFKSSTAVPITNASSVVIISLIVAYGIATKRILNVSTILRRLVAQGLLTAYLVSLYMLVWIISKFVLANVFSEPQFISHLLAALAIAFSMAPAHGKLQDFADKMISTYTVNIPALMKHSGMIFQSVTTYDALIQQFSELLQVELGAEDVRILTAHHEGYAQQYPAPATANSILMDIDSPIAKIICSTRDSVSYDSLTRTRQSALIIEAIEKLEELATVLAVGFFSKTSISGIILFGSRRGGRIYDKAEQDALQILCNQFAVALENAQLYTEVQDSKIRNEIMLDQLVSGVIVSNPERKIALFNHEAQRITGIEEAAAIGKDIADLPKPIRLALETTLDNKAGERNVEARLFEQDESRNSLNIRMGTTYLIGHDKKPMGALLVFTDMTELKSLEEQVRRSDQLSSVGTLAAGMAHEIKNPLVTIKTFTQLLPQRYADDDFRNDFSTLVAHEVARIDGIVNELLSFSKPTKPHLVPMKVHDVIEQTIKLTHEQMVQKNIVVKNGCNARKDNILGDAKLLSQALINLTLNAIEAIGKEGTITVGTTNCRYSFANGEGPDRSTTKQCIRIQISDTGQGIAPDHIKKVFDPFFTCKSEGTGMGLSVAHGIIQEHHGVVDVESELGKGSTFYVYIPLMKEMTS